MLTGDREPLSTLLSTAQRVELDQNAVAGSSDRATLVHIVAIGTFGRLRVSFDPDRSFQPTHVEIHRDAESLVYGKPVRDIATGVPNLHFRTMTQIVDLSDFKLRADLWQPTRVDVRQISEFSDGRRIECRGQATRVFTDLPPAAELDAALEPDVPDGTPAFPREASGVRYEWKSGQAIPVIPAASIDRASLAGEEAAGASAPSDRSTGHTVAAVIAYSSIAAIIVFALVRLRHRGSTIALIISLSMLGTPRAEGAAKSESGLDQPYCGIYSLIAVGRYLGLTADYTALIQPKFISSRDGSSLANLMSAASLSQMKQLASSANTIIIDARGPADFEAGHSTSSF